MWSEQTLLDAVVADFGAHQPIHLLRQVEIEDRRIDAVLIIGERRIGIEAKTNRADFRRESDAKRAPTWSACHECVYLSPPGVIEPRDLPDGWGLWHAITPALVAVVREGMRHGAHPYAADRLLTAVMRRAATTERRIRVAERTDDPAGALAAVDAEVMRLEGLLAAQSGATAREKARAQDAAEQVLALTGPQVCSACDEPIVYTRVGAWRHVSRAQETTCEAARAEAERLRREVEFGAAYSAVPAPRVVPRDVSVDC